MSEPVTEIGFALLRPGHANADLSQAAATLLAQPGCLRVRSAHLLDGAGAEASPDQHQHRAAWFVDWESTGPWRAFRRDRALHGPFAEELASHLAEEPQVLAAVFSPSPSPSPSMGAFEVGNGAQGDTASPATELLRIYFPAGELTPERRAAAERTVRSFLDKVAGREDVEVGGEVRQRSRAAGLVGEPALGWSSPSAVDEEEGDGVVGDFTHAGQPCRVLVVAIGWESVAAHVAYRQTPEFAAVIGMLRGLEGKVGMEMHHVNNKVW